MILRTKQGNTGARRLRFITAVCAAALLPLASACSGSEGTTQKPQPGVTVNETLMQTLDSVSTNTLDTKILPTSVSLKGISGPPVHPGEKPTVLYMGADYCPYCAALRWPLTLALMRFGQFSDLKYMRSSHDDVYADTVTFSFHGASYQSDYVNFEGVEFQDREGKPLQKPNARQLEIFKTFNAQPYTRYPGAIPFLYLDGNYMQVGAPFSPAILKGLSWKEVANKLQEPKSSVRQTLLGVTNVYTAAICKITDGEPKQVCSAKAVTAAAARLPGSHQ